MKKDSQANLPGCDCLMMLELNYSDSSACRALLILYRDTVEGEEEDGAAADPVQAGGPHGAGVGAAEDAVQAG